MTESREQLASRLDGVRRCIELLLQRIHLEEYGHAKAAVALDVERLEEYHRELQKIMQSRHPQY